MKQHHDLEESTPLGLFLIGMTTLAGAYFLIVTVALNS